jgi:DNA-binding NarL/FixJ family response regulator
MASLTEREKTVITLIAAGLTDKNIALRLDITAGTVKNHVTSAVSKLDARNRPNLMIRALQKGILHLDSKGVLK